jgi:hypothetical protein
MDAARFDRLSEGQKECLRLFHARWEIKDIARQIGRSPVTVNQRLAAARKHLGVDRSAEAARLLAEHENGTYTPPPYVPDTIPEAAPEQPSTQQEHEERHPAIPLPFPTAGRPNNDLSFGGKLAYSLLLAALIALVFGGGVAALSGLSDLF